MPDQPSPAQKPALTLKRRLNASPQKVFRAWTDPQQVMHWWGPAGAEFLSAEIDARVGGQFRKTARTADGEEHEVSGTYLEVIPDQKLVFSWAWRGTPERQSLVTIELKPDGDGTLLTLTHEQFYDEAARDAHRRGWTGTLEKLEHYLAQP
jgi:uncharacterized protein YndB with AHSA1/START domain